MFGLNSLATEIALLGTAICLLSWQRAAIKDRSEECLFQMGNVSPLAKLVWKLPLNSGTVEASAAFFW